MIQKVSLFPVPFGTAVLIYLPAGAIIETVAFVNNRDLCVAARFDLLKENVQEPRTVYIVPMDESIKLEDVKYIGTINAGGAIVSLYEQL